MSSETIVAGVRRFLAAHPPFAQMAPAHVDRFIAEASQGYYAPDEPVLSPAMGPVSPWSTVLTT